MVVKSFRHSLSFSIPNSKPTVLKIKGRGSTSLPCRFPPFISQLQDEIHALRTWQFHPQTGPGSPSWILHGLDRLDHLHAALDDLLQHPQAHDSLRRRSCWTHQLLDHFLLFADAYNSFRSAIVGLKDRQSATQAAIRREDEPRIASCVRSQRKAEKELVKLAAEVRNVGKWASVSEVTSDVAEAELEGIMREVTVVTAWASASLFAGIVGLSSAALVSASVCSRSLRGSCMVGSMIWRLGSFKKREEGDGEEKCRRRALERLEALEECVGVVERRSERVFRSLVNNRVFLLNLLTPSLRCRKKEKEPKIYLIENMEGES